MSCAPKIIKPNTSTYSKMVRKLFKILRKIYANLKLNFFHVTSKKEISLFSITARNLSHEAVVTFRFFLGSTIVPRVWIRFSLEAKTKIGKRYKVWSAKEVIISTRSFRYFQVSIRADFFQDTDVMKKREEIQKFAAKKFKYFSDKMKKILLKHLFFFAFCFIFYHPLFLLEFFLLNQSNICRQKSFIKLFLVFFPSTKLYHFFSTKFSQFVTNLFVVAKKIVSLHFFRTQVHGSSPHISSITFKFLVIARIEVCIQFHK